MRVLPPLRIPRALLDPRRHDLPPADADGLVAVQVEQEGGTVTGLRGWSGDGSPGSADGPPGGLPLAVTPPVEPHAHLDKAFTADAFPNPEGTMAAALAANVREAEAREAGGLRERGERALRLAWSQGLRAVRSHVDSLGPGAEVSWEVLAELREHWRERVELQLVALVPVGHWLTPAGEDLARRVTRLGGLLGGVLGMPYPPGPSDRDAVLALLRLAERHGCGVDLHVDESDRGTGQGVALVSELMIAHRIGVPLVCSHASSLGLAGPGPCARRAERLAEAGIAVVALPTTNFWLLGKEEGRTPVRRPLAPIRQLQAAGVPVAVGGDNVQDPWFPGGSLDPIDLLRFTLAACHLAPWRRLGLAPFTTAAARVLGLPWDGVLREGGPSDLVVLAAPGWRELLACTPQRRVLRGGRWLPPPAWQDPSPLLAGLRT